MDKAGLHDSLRTKLDQLEAKLEAHRQDLLGDLHQYYQDLTRDTAPSAIAIIEEQLPSLLAEYKTLRPSSAQLKSLSAATDDSHAESPQPPPVSDSTASTPETATTFQTLSLASSLADSGQPVAPGSPRDRDHELQGLFTPSYLPLLSASARLDPDAPVSPTTSATTSTNITTTASVAPSNPLPAEIGRPSAECNSASGTTTQTNMDQAAEGSRFPGRLTTTPIATATPRHRSSEGSEAAADDAATADDANSSAASDKSDNKTPRSALRRSSSIYKSPQSPRRVRFEFMGAEVLPTASPQASETMMPRSESPAWEGENVTLDSVLGDDAEDLGPPPRKISSSDALRALSREPLEEDTVWTEVNADADAGVSHKMQQVDLNQSNSAESAMEQIQQEPDDDFEDDDEGETLAMKKKAKPAPVAATPSASVVENKPSPKGKAPMPPSDEIDGDDDMFAFEDEGGHTTTPQSRSATNDVESDDEDTTDAKGDGLATLRSPTTVAPATVPVAKPEPAEPTTPTTPRFHVGSVGSYKGRSIIMPVVKNPEVHAKAASIGNFNSFVGGLDGKSGMDAADLSSYRASFMRDGFSGTPRSFTERLLMEEMEAERQKEQQS